MNRVAEVWMDENIERNWAVKGQLISGIWNENKIGSDLETTTKKKTMNEAANMSPDRLQFQFLDLNFGC